MDGLEQARKELHALLAKPSLVGIPLLVLGNKDDLPQSLTTNELIDRLELKVCCTAVSWLRRLCAHVCNCIILSATARRGCVIERWPSIASHAKVRTTSTSQLRG